MTQNIAFPTAKAKAAQPGCGPAAPSASSQRQRLPSSALSPMADGTKEQSRGGHGAAAPPHASRPARRHGRSRPALAVRGRALSPRLASPPRPVLSRACRAIATRPRVRSGHFPQALARRRRRDTASPFPSASMRSRSPHRPKRSPPSFVGGQAPRPVRRRRAGQRVAAGRRRSSGGERRLRATAEQQRLRAAAARTQSRVGGGHGGARAAVSTQIGGSDAWAETQKGEERTHFCVALLFEPKMRRSFAFSVGERF